MPIVESSYRPNWAMTNPHFNTIWPTLFRTRTALNLQRERLELNDGDFLDLDWCPSGSGRLAIISHGMEGSSRAVYVMGLSRALVRHGWDVLAWNFRGCSGEPNRTERFYHSGASEDLRAVVEHASARYESVSLIGFSMGGNITLKYLAEEGHKASGRITGAVAVSVPCDLASAAARLAEVTNIIYMKRFLRLFKVRMQEKARRFPQLYSLQGYSEIKNFKSFDDRYTAPIHGFSCAEDYWEQSSCGPMLPRVGVKTLIINAMDDPFLGSQCFPYEICKKSENIYLEIPRYGGHVGFVEFNKERIYWSEKRVMEFLDAGWLQSH
ncbi:MAG: alpha/beta fold hydrolase [Deltaproteobacteria bacterium]|nr:alpha/beta fold hydrolase [Deltaproteobacteria bacterium]